MKNIVIIGAGKGIGLKATEILSQSENIFSYSRSITPELEDLSSTNFEFDSLQSDYSIFDSLPEVIDALVYCPGSINLKPFHRISEDEFLQDYKQNVLGAIKTIQYLLPRLKKSGNGNIVLFSSVAVQIGMTFHTVVSSSKGAIEGLTRSLAAELAPNIRVNCIAPSLTITSLSEKLTATEEKIENAAQRHPLKRIGKPEDIAEMVAFLVSEKSSWITGQILHIDGGMSTIK